MNLNIFYPLYNFPAINQIRQNRNKYACLSGYFFNLMIKFKPLYLKLQYFLYIREMYNDKSNQSGSSYHSDFDPSSHNKSFDSDSITKDNAKLYSSQRFLQTDLPSNAMPKSDVSAAQLFYNLNSSLEGLFSKIEALKQEHTIQQHTPKYHPKKNMDVSGFPMPNLSSNNYLKGFPNRNVVLKIPPPTREKTLKDLNSSADEKKSVSPPTQQIFNRNKSSRNIGSQKQPIQSPTYKIKTYKIVDDKSVSDFSLKNIFDENEAVSYVEVPTKKDSPKKFDFNQVLQGNQYNVNVKHHDKVSQGDDHLHQQSAFHKNQFNNSNFLKHGLMSMPNLKVSMQITEQHLKTDSPKKHLNLDSIIEKQVQQTYMVKKSIIFNQAKLRDFELGKLVGSGKFGDVHICRHKQTGTMFALKKIFKSTILEYNMVNQFTRQLKIHYRLDHPNIIKLYAHFDDEYHVFLLMEYAEGGILMDKLKCAEDIASRYVEQTIDAVQYLHKLKIAHRDIKPENIVLQFQSVIKLCDFGWASYYENQMKTTFCGTLDYLSPQMKEKGQYDNSVDIWSIGVLTYELLTGSPPYRKELMLSMKNGFGPSKPGARKINWNINYPPYISPLAESFIRNILKQNPEDRCTLRFCSNHTFIKKYQQKMEDLSHFQEFIKVV